MSSLQTTGNGQTISLVSPELSPGSSKLVLPPLWAIKCFPGPGPLLGTHATITSGVALSARVPVDRMDTEAKCGGTCTGLPRQGSTQTHASAKPPLEGLCPSGSVVWLRGRDPPALVTWKGEEGLR